MWCSLKGQTTIPSYIYCFSYKKILIISSRKLCFFCIVLDFLQKHTNQHPYYTSNYNNHIWTITTQDSSSKHHSVPSCSCERGGPSHRATHLSELKYGKNKTKTYWLQYFSVLQDRSNTSKDCSSHMVTNGQSLGWQWNVSFISRLFFNNT